jgi:serine phosphatase RsbU (regulator of sigma subunit)/CHASE3 domain sensor protein
VSLRNRLLAVCGLGLVLTIVAAWILIGSAATQRRQAGDQRSLTTAIADSTNLLARYDDEETGLRGYLLAGGQFFLQPESDAVAAVPKLEADLRSQAARLEGTLPLVQDMVSAHQRWATSILRVETGDVAAGRLAEAQALEAGGSGKVLFDRIRAASTRLRDTLSQRLITANQRASRSASQLKSTLVVVLTALVVLVAGLFGGLLRLVLRPLSAVGKDVRRVAGGSLDDPIGVYGPKEVRELAADAEAMRFRLRDEMRQGLRAAEALNQHAPAVVALQEALAAETPAVAGLELAIRLEPAEGILAGDWIDAFALPGRRLGVVVGDVAGHGPRPAVFALRLKTMLSANLAAGRTPGGSLTWACQQLLTDDAEMFATVFLAVIDLNMGTITYANGGHPEAYLLVEGALPSALPATGPLLSGLLAHWAWGDTERDFPVGAVLAAYTDGGVEARNPEGVQFGTTRLLAELAVAADTHHRGRVRDLADVLADTIEAVQAHSGVRLTDDCSLLACRRTA